jgi:hypothetical protein
MSKEIIQFNEGVIKEELRELVRGSVEETLNNLLEKEAQAVFQKISRNEKTIQEITGTAYQGGVIGFLFIHISLRVFPIHLIELS